METQGVLRCVVWDMDPKVNVTIVDLPGQIGMMQKNIEGKKELTVSVDSQRIFLINTLAYHKELGMQFG